MRFLPPMLLALIFASCATRPPAPPTATPVAEAVVAPSPAPVPSPVSAPIRPISPARVTEIALSGISFAGIAFDSREYRLAVVDQPNGPGSAFADAASAARARGAVAAINAGFFTPEGAPLGLVVSSWKPSGSWNSASSLGSGVWFESPSGTGTIARREKLGKNSASGMRELIQAGPLLVENGRSVGGLESNKSSARSIVLWDGGTRWWMGCSSPCTLAALGQALASVQPAGWPVRQALNLDGGRSSDLWISATIPGGPVLRRPPWNRPVRNFLVLLGK